jgi:DNA-binding transcriptional regulator GbsR (MarR family)
MIETMPYSPRRRLEDNLVAAYARVCQIYGIPPSVGRLVAVLYLSPKPMSLAELSDAVGAAKSTTSVSLRRLERYRFVRRLPRGSDRKDYYEAVTDPLEVMQEWMRYFVMPELAVGADMMVALETDLKAAGDAGEYSDEEFYEMRLRTAEMRRAMAAAKSVLKFVQPDASLDEMVGEVTDYLLPVGEGEEDDA